MLTQETSFKKLIKTLPPIMSMDEVTKIFKLSRSTIFRLREDGEIESIKAGKDKQRSRVLIITESLLEYLGYPVN